ncbi:MAG: hypothetical protein ACREUY_03870 [Burkholderiales bacterium]
MTDKSLFCASCPFWRHNPDLQIPPIKNGEKIKIGICYGGPPVMVVMSMEVAEASMLVNAHPKTRMVSIPTPVRPYTLETDPACFYHPDGAELG